MEFQFDVAADHPFARSLHADSQRDGHIRTDTDAHVRRGVRYKLSEGFLGWSLELDHSFGASDRHQLAGAHVDRYSGPTPTVDFEFDRDEGFDRRTWSHTRHLAIALILASHYIFDLKPAYRFHQFTL